MTDTVPGLLADRAARSPDAIAFHHESGSAWDSIRWSEFAQRVHALARGLGRRGLQQGDHVGILAPTGLAWELMHHAILHAGGVVVGLEPHDTAERLQWIADHAEIRMLIVQDVALLSRLDAKRTEHYACVVVLDPAMRAGPGSNSVAMHAVELEGSEGHGALPVIFPEFPATLIYTSGTTGQPKGILYRHAQVVRAVSAICAAYPTLPVGARFVCWLPLSNLFQRIMNLAALSVGGTVYLVGNPLAIMQALPVAQPDVFIGVPRFYEKLYEGISREIERKPAWLRALLNAAIRSGDAAARASRDGRPLSLMQRWAHALADRFVLLKLRQSMGGRVRFMITGSAPTPVRLLEFFDAIGLPLYEAYGLSENIVPMALNRPGELRLGTVGKPLSDNTMRLEEDGELVVKGPGVFSGYHRDDRPEIFTADGYYRTGDYAAFDDDGYLRLRGRKSEIIKTSTGRRISPLGIEAKLEELPFVDRAVVIGSGRKCLTAILVLKPEEQRPDSPSASTDFAASIARAIAALSSHEQPLGYLVLKEAFTIESGCLTPNLKLRRQMIEARFQERLEELYAAIDSGDGKPVIANAPGS